MLNYTEYVPVVYFAWRSLFIFTVAYKPVLGYTIILLLPALLIGQLSQKTSKTQLHV